MLKILTHDELVELNNEILAAYIWRLNEVFDKDMRMEDQNVSGG